MTTDSITNQFSEIRDGMQIDWNVPIQMDDGMRCTNLGDQSVK